MKNSIFEVGNVFDTRESGKAEIVEYISSKQVVVKFLNSGNIKSVNTTNLRTGRIKDAELFAKTFWLREGTIHKTNNFGDIEIVKYVNQKDITVKFLNTGNTYNTSGSCVAGGKIADTKYKDAISKYRKGLVFSTEKFGKFVITENIGLESVKILFLDTGTELVVDKESVLNLTVEDVVTSVGRSSDNKFCVYLHKNAFGTVRYVGEGTLQRAYSSSRPDQPKWEALFRGKDFTVEIVSKDLSKCEAEKLEIELREKYSDTIINDAFAKKTPHKISKAFVEKYVYYDETSPTCLRWVNPMKNNAKAHDAAGHLKNKGYATVEIAGVSFAVHRVVFTLAYGDFDSGYVVDHIDGNKHNNKISNLRLVTHKQNAFNKLLPKIPISGYRHIRLDRTGYIVRWTENDFRKSRSFAFNSFDSNKECLIAAYNFRESLILKGYICHRIKEGEAEID